MEHNTFTLVVDSWSLVAAAAMYGITNILVALVNKK